MSWLEPNPKGWGILVALDEKIEWLLPWWWSNYTAHNDLPVVFVDFGMSNFGKTFCSAKGKLLPFKGETKCILSSDQLEKGKEMYGEDFIEKRACWLKKPLSLLMTPFEKTLWLDLDCEVLSSVAPLFTLEGEVLLAEETLNATLKEKELRVIPEEATYYNAGVILYTHGASLIETWAHMEGEYFADQQALAHLIHNKKISIPLIPKEFNWRMSDGINLGAVIIHWVGEWGKAYIRRFGGFKEELKRVFPGHHF